jgi:molybdopterin-binding protein
MACHRWADRPGAWHHACGTTSIASAGVAVVVDIGGQEIVAAITRGSADTLALKKGNRVTVVIKSTDVMIAK